MAEETKDPIEELDIVGEDIPTIEEDKEISTIESIVFATNKLKQPLIAAPTYTPSNFYEQFAHYDGALYCNINNSWTEIAPTFKTGQISKSASFGTGTQEVTCGFKPKMIVFESYGIANNSSTATGVYDVVNDDEYDEVKYWNSGNLVHTAHTASSIYIVDDGGTPYTVGTISATSSTSFTINWTQDGAGIHLIWKAYK